MTLASEGAAASEAQTLIDDVLSIGVSLHLPPISVPAAVAKAMVDIGFALFLRRVAEHVKEQAAAQTAGAAAIAASAVTTEQERERRRAQE